MLSLSSKSHSTENFFFNNFIYLVFFFFFPLAVLDLPCCARAFSSCNKQELPFVVVRGPLTAAASFVVGLRL